jgi:hypothetical protein
MVCINRATGADFIGLKLICAGEGNKKGDQMKHLGITALVAFITALIVGGGAQAQMFIPYSDSITVKEYLREAGEVARYVPAGKLRLAGRRMQCGKRPSIIDPEFDTWAGAYTDPGFIIVNPIYMEQELPVVQWYIYSHECGHQFRGFDEDTADAFAIRRGVRQGWLKDRGMRQICKFISQVPGDSEHPPGPVRCERMKVVYADIVKRHERHIARKEQAKRGASMSIGPRN